MQEVWTFSNSVECRVTRTFAWRFWTNVNNWKLDADVEAVALTGPFASGSHGTTVTRSSGRIEWRLVDVRDEVEATVEISLPGALGRFHWTFEDLGGTTRITQRVSFGGEQVLALAGALDDGLARGIPAGMQKLSESMEQSARSTD